MATSRKPKVRKPRRTSTPKPPSAGLWETAFLAAFRKTGNVSIAAESCGIDRTTAYLRRDTHPTFATAWESAREDAADALAEEARRRAHDGVGRLKFWQGDPIMIPLISGGQPVRDDTGEVVMVPYIEHEYSDGLLMFLLKASRPDTYRDNHKVEHTGTLAQVHVYLPAKNVVPNASPAA